LLSFGALARNTLWMTVGQGIRILVQAVYFVLIARILHKEGYGAFSGVVALVAVFAPFAGWGSGNLLIKNVAHDATRFPVYWGRALIVSFLSAGVLTLVSLLIAWWILPRSVSLLLVLWVAFADLLFTRVLEVSAQAFQAVHQLAKTALLSILYSLARLAAVVVLIRLHPADALMTWAILYLLSTALVTVVGALWVTLEFGRPRWDPATWRQEFAEGFYFASSFSAQRIYMDSDKALLTRLSSLESAGIYAAATRIIDVAFVPVNSLLAAAYARFFIAGREGVQGTLRLSKALLPASLAYSFLAGIVLYMLAPFIPLFLGTEFAETVTAVRWLAVIPLLMTLHRFAADSLTGAGWQSTRTRIEFGAAVFNLVVNVCLVPYYSWRGAAWATILTEVTLIFLLGLALQQIVKFSHSAASVQGDALP